MVFQAGVLTTRGLTTSCLTTRGLLPGGLTSSGLYKQGSLQAGVLQAGVLQLGVLTTRCLTTRSLRTWGSYNRGFLQLGVLTTRGVITWGCYNQGPAVRRPISANPGLNFNPGFFFFCSKVFSRVISSLLFRASNHQIVGRKNKTEFASQAFISEIKFCTNRGLT